MLSKFCSRSSLSCTSTNTFRTLCSFGTQHQNRRPIRFSKKEPAETLVFEKATQPQKWHQYYIYRKLSSHYFRKYPQLLGKEEEEAGSQRGGEDKSTRQRPFSLTQFIVSGVVLALLQIYSRDNNREKKQTPKDAATNNNTNAATATEAQTGQSATSELSSSGHSFVESVKSKKNDLLKALSEIKQIDIISQYGTKFITYNLQAEFKNGQTADFPVGDPNVFLSKLEAGQDFLGFPESEYIPVRLHHSTPQHFHENMSNVVWSVVYITLIGILLKNRKGFSINTVMGKPTKKKLASEKDIKVRFQDVAGMEEAKLEITEFVDFLRNNKKFRDMGAKIPRGALLTGPPGTGKTMLAKACAGQAGVPFFYMSGSDFVEMFVGVGAARVRDLFAEAKAEAPSIIFIDEIDTVGRKREGMSNEEKDSTLNQLLVEMDGFETDQNVIVLAASNRKEVLDKALTRPGRFDRLIQVDLPDVKGRQQIFKVHLKPLKLDPSKTIEEFAKRLAILTPRFSGADIQNLCNEAAILAVRRGSAFVEHIDFQMAHERVFAGLEKRNLMTPDNKRVVSYHEAGHAVTAWFLEGGDPLVKVTIIPRSKGSLGYAQYLPSESQIQTRQQLMDKLIVMLGGRIAEEHFFGKITTGASDDLQRLHQLARTMVMELGMSPLIGNVGFGKGEYQDSFSKNTSKLIDEQTTRIIKEAEKRCRDLVADKAQYIQKLAKVLMEKETLSSAEIAGILGKRPFEIDPNYKEYLEAAQQA